MTYDDFEVRMLAAGSGRLVIRVDCEAGEDSVEAGPELGPAEGLRLFSSFRAAVSRRGTTAGNTGAPRNLAPIEQAPGDRDLGDLGRSLFRFLLPPALQSLWNRCRDRSADRGHGLRLRLHIDLRRRELAWLGALPWELVYDEDSGGFLALDGRTPVVRYLDLRKDRRRLPRARPWRVLVVMANPEGTAALNLEAERSHLVEAWKGGGRVELVFPERNTFDAIRRELTRGPIHGIHYMGHGVFDEGTGWGGLLLEGGTGGAAPLLGPEIKDLVRGIEPPAFVVLNGCETGRSAAAGPEPFGGAAAALMEAGVPAVVAMQLPVADDEAIHFSRILYQGLQDGLPVDRAVSEARLSLSRAFGDRQAWAIPSLFLRVPDGRLFEEEVQAPGNVAGRPKITARTIVDSVKGGRVRTIGDESPEGAHPEDEPSILAVTKVGEAENTDISTVGRRRGR